MVRLQITESYNVYLGTILFSLLLVPNNHGVYDNDIEISSEGVLMGYTCHKNGTVGM